MIDLRCYICGNNIENACPAPSCQYVATRNLLYLDSLDRMCPDCRESVDCLGDGTDCTCVCHDEDD